MAINKVILNGEVKVDLTDTTAMPEDVLEDKVFYNAKGERVVGTGTGGIKSGIEIPLEGFNAEFAYEPEIEFTIAIPEGVTSLTTNSLFNNATPVIYNVYIPESFNYMAPQTFLDNGNFSVYKIYTKDFQKYAYACLGNHDDCDGSQFYYASFACLDLISFFINQLK